jgi:hypothetical protein
MAACVAEKFAALKVFCMCNFATAPSWQDEHTAAIGVILKLSAELVVDAPVLMVVARMPLAVGAAQSPVS